MAELFAYDQREGYDMKTAVVTGTSTGIGLSTSLLLARKGWKVFAGMRNLKKADELRDAAEKEKVPVEIIELDVTDDKSVDTAFAAVSKDGPIDVLVNNAGIGAASPLELVPDDEHRQLFETNYFGVVRCIQRVMPQMREAKAGTIINISSIVGIMPTPNQIPYSASKWAVEGLSYALAHELKRFGVRVSMVEPGVIMTKIFDNSAEATRYDKTSPYKSLMRRNGKIYGAGFELNTPPEVVANVIHEAITTKDYKLRWPAGPDAEAVFKRMNKFAPEDFVALGADLSDQEYNDGFFEMIGMRL
jgi:NAD(P)-dependent dehydrogenase (short-subunit alcohol dehydrogenase family)